MAKNMQPIAKRCHALGISPAVMGYAKKTTNRNPGGQMRKKKSEYALQLNEKQKVKFVYGIMERQFRAYYDKATRMTGKTGENLLVCRDPQRGPPAGKPCPFHSKRQESKHPLLSGKAGRCCGSSFFQPFFREIQQTDRRGCPHGNPAPVAGA